MDRLQTSPASCVLTHPRSAGQSSSILNQNPSIATSSRSMANDPSLLLKVNKAEFFIRKLQCYWTAVADDLGPVIWAQPTNMYRQIWEQEISAADSKLEYLRDQIREMAFSTNPNPNRDPFRCGLRDIGSPSNQKINAHHLPPYLQEGLNAQDRALASHETQASNKRTWKRKLTRQRAKARRSTREANPFVYQSLSNSTCPLNANRRLVTKRIEPVQNQIQALRQRLTITSVPKSEDRLFRYEGNDEKENCVSPGLVGFDVATSWKSNESNRCLYQSLSNSPRPLDTNRRLVTKKRIETVQEQILALRQRLTITSVPNKFRCHPNSEDRLFRFEANDEKENRVYPGSVGFDTPNSWKSNERLSKVDGDKYDEGPGSCAKKDIRAYSGTPARPARTFGSSFAANIDKYSTARED